MCRYRILALTFLSLTGLLFAQNQPAHKDFTGTWQASFKGAVFMTLKIQHGDKLSGTMTPGRISVNDDGDLIEAEAADGEAEPIANARIEGEALSFDWKEKDDTEVVTLEVKLTGENEAELRFRGEARIKPIHLRRAG